MGILRRLSDATRTTLDDLKEARLKRSGKPLSELSDDELEQELVRRRRARAQAQASGRRGRSTAPRGPEPEPEEGSPQRKQLLQYYANLELPPGASLEQVRRAYRELMRKYHPDRHAGDPDKQRAATELAQSLTHAYKALSEHLRRKE